MSILLKPFDKIYNLARANSLTPFVYASSCCGTEILSLAAFDNNNINFDNDIICQNPRHSDLLIVAGVITDKSAEILKNIYEQMPEPKYVIAAGVCACSGGVFKNASYSVICGADKIIPVDIYLPMCPPEPEDILNAITKLKEKIMSETILKRKEYINSHISDSDFSENEDILTDKNIKQEE